MNSVVALLVEIATSPLSSIENRDLARGLLWKLDHAAWARVLLA